MLSSATGSHLRRLRSRGASLSAIADRLNLESCDARMVVSAGTSRLFSQSIGALVLAAALTNAAVLSFPWVSVGALVVFATVLHPTMGGFLRSLRSSRADRGMLGLVAVAAAPLLAFAFSQPEQQRRGVGEHAMLGHYGFMAAFSFTVIGIGLLSSVRPERWRPLAWVAGAGAASLGLTSILCPDVESRLELPAALAAIGWSVAFVTQAERIVRSRAPSERRAVPTGTRSFP
jgi:hypothetical protein